MSGHLPLHLHIPTSLIDQMIAEASSSSTQEVCGLLFGVGLAIMEIEPTANVAADPARRFEVDPAALIAAHRRGRERGRGRGQGAGVASTPALIGHYHSHPNGRAEPSACDAEMALADGSIWLIIAGGEVTAWRAVEGGARHGRFDALPILRC